MRIAYGVLAACLLFGLTGCSSNNKGKIVGKWQHSGGAGVPAGAMSMEFTEDGKFRMYALGQVISSGTYSLGFGDSVILSDLSPPLDGKTKSNESISISGDTMTVKGEKGQDLTLKRVTEATPPPAGK